MKRTIRYLWTLSFLLACPVGQGVTGNYKFAKEQVLKIGNGVEPKELDPTITTGVSEAHILSNLFEGLTDIDPYTFEVVPGVAESWTVAPDNLVYTFKLRANTKWSDGTPLTAKDFVYSWTRALKPETASEYAYQLFYIKNGEAFNKGTIKDATQLGVQAVDERTLKVTLENPTAFFLRLTSFHTLFPTPKHVIEKFPGPEWTKQGNMVSNGAFKMTEWKLNQYVKVVPNPHYWDKEKIKLSEVYFYAIENSDTEEKTFISGDLHMTSTVPTPKVPVYAKQIAAAPNAYHPYKNTPYLGTYYYRLNTTKPPLNDVRVRRALALTIDRKQIVDRILQGGQLPAHGFTPAVSGYAYQGSLPLSVTPKEVTEAKRLLTEAGFPDGKGLPKISIIYNTNEGHKKIAVALQQMWKKNLGIEVELYNQEWKVYLDTTRKLDYTISRAGWIGDYPDPNTFLDMWVTNGGNNQTGWSNKEYDRLIDEASKTGDQAQRFALFKQAEDILIAELPVLPVYYYTKQCLVAPTLKMFKDKDQITEWQSNISDLWILKHYALVDAPN